MAKRKTKKELETARELAYILYLNHTPNIEIAERVGVSQQAVSGWVSSNEWREKRAAKTITRTELTNKILSQISNMLDKEDGLDSGDSDKLSKLAATVEKLDKKNSPVMAIEVFIQFSKFLQNNLNTGKDLSVDFIKLVNKYQDAFITSLMTG